MLDAHIRPVVDPTLDMLGGMIARTGLSANFITILGFGFGLTAIPFIVFESYTTGLVFILLNRLFDGLDGGVARYRGITDIGGYLDIVCDFVIYAGVAFAFALARSENAPWIAFLIFSYIGAITSFLAYAIMAERRGMENHERGEKSFYYLGGISEGTETIIVMVAMCILPNLIAPIALIYGVMCWLTFIGRSLQAWRDFA